MNKVCPLMIIGNNRKDILDTPFGNDAFDATRFQCIGSQCAAFQLTADRRPYCGMVQRIVSQEFHDIKKQK
jgi:hypothetical protein